MKRILPFEKITYRTRLSKNQVLDRLNTNIEPKRIFNLFGKPYTRLYTGIVRDDSFKIERVIQYRNSFRPVITGNVYTDYKGTAIDVKMKMVTPVLVLTTIWFIGILIGCIATTIMMMNDGVTIPMLIPHLLLVLGIVMVTGGFKMETSKSKNDLSNILEAEIEE